MAPLLETIRQTLTDFTFSFIENPYVSYTEHGLHAQFFTRIYNQLPPEQRYTHWCNRKLCVVQKEYPTADSLGKSQRQHWDIALVKTPAESAQNSYDYLRLAAVVEFGMNEKVAHLIDDIERLTHAKANVDCGFLVHLYRLSAPGSTFSGRDWSANSKQIVSPEFVAELTEEKSVEIYYGIHDDTGRYPTTACLIKNGSVYLLDHDSTSEPIEIHSRTRPIEYRESEIITACSAQHPGPRKKSSDILD